MPNATENANDTKHGETTLEDLANESIGSEPRVREEVVSKLEAEQNDEMPNESSSSVSDSPKYEQFNPNIHAVDATGNPIKTKSGQFAKKRGRKAGQQANNPNPSSSQAEPQSNPQVNYAGLASLATSMVFGMLSSTLGDHWQPKPEENAAITECTAKYMESLGMTDIPPGILLICVVGLYALPRALHPDTKKRLQELGVIDAPPAERKPVTNVNRG
jgi:hypothetical protein